MTTTERRRIAGRLQDVIGRAMNEYHNDRDPERADKLSRTLAEAFDLAIALNSSYAVRRGSR